MERSTPPESALPLDAWQAIQALDPKTEDDVATLAACLALVEQQFQLLYHQVLRRFGEVGADDLSAEADALADAHHALTVLQESVHASSRRMLDVLDRVSRELGE
jgi:hypothetical protein